MNSLHCSRTEATGSSLRAKPDGQVLTAVPAVVPARRTKGLTAYAGEPDQRPVNLWLDANEGPLPQDAARLLDSITPESLRRYPSSRTVESMLARKWNVSTEQLIVTAGADDALERICRAWLDPGRVAITTKPTFSMIWRYITMNEGVLREVPWLDGLFPAGQVLALADREVPALVFMVSPNNPTGSAASLDDLRALSEALPSTIIVLDQAYAEFADKDLTPQALRLPNVIVTRTLSKAYGLAGLRIGYALGSGELIAPLRVVGHPYSVAGPSLAMAAAALARGDLGTSESVARVRLERTQLAAHLRALDVWSVPSQANFVLARIGPGAWHVRNALAERGIGVRAFRDDPTLATFLRITCPASPQPFERLLAALDEVIRP